MTPLEILHATLQNQATPRIPVFCNLLDQGARTLNLSQETYYASGEQVAQAQLAMRQRFGYDNLWSLFYVGKEAELLGCEKILFSDHGTPNVADFVIKEAADIQRLHIPEEITAHPAWQETATCIKLLKEESRGRYPICAYLTASATLPALLMGMDKWMELFLLGPFDLRDHLLEKCSLFFQRHLAAYRDAGVDVLLYSNPFASPSMVGMKRFNTFALPWMKRDLANVSMAGLVFYCGLAPFNPIIRQVMDELGFTIFYLSPQDDLAQAKALIGHHGLTCGVMDDIKMIHWNPQQTRQAVKTLCQTGMPGGPFLLGSGVMPQAIPEANIAAMVEAAFEYGAKP